MLKTIFFDNDGVLVDTERYFYQANKEIFLELGIALTAELFCEHFLKTSHGILHFLRPLGLNDAEIQEIRNKREVIFRKLLSEEPISVDGAEAVLATLHASYQLVIVTSAKRSNIELMHRRTGFLRYFDFIICEEDYKEPKPHPDPYLTALRRSGVTPEQALVVEDSERGLLAANAAGISCAIIENELSRGSDFSKAATILQHLTQLPAYVKTI